MGRDGLVTVPTDDRFKMRPELLPAAPDEARRRGRQPVAVVASACSTSTGIYDDLNALADFCAAHRLWLLVDGAHGAAVAFCPELKSQLAGIKRALQHGARALCSGQQCARMHILRAALPARKPAFRSQRGAAG